MTQSIFTCSENTVIEISREGGFAPVPELSGLRRCSLKSLQASEGKQLCQLLNQLSSYKKSKKTPWIPQGADQRYFLITVSDSVQKTGNIILEIPEEAAPAALIQFWQTGSFATP